MKPLKKLWSLLTSYPDSWDDYFPLGRWLIYKRLPVILAVLALVAGALLLWHSRPQPAEEIPTFSLSDPARFRYSGQAVLTGGDAAVYRGQVVAGLRSGFGEELVSGKDGAEELVYKGGFERDLRHGKGTLYHGGIPLYEGEFRDGLYDGAGVLLDQDGETVLYRGQFSQGLYQGAGTLFREGAPLYEGGFSQGVYDGDGTLYDSGGSLLYTGGFRRGSYEGRGVEWHAGAKRYEGGFKNGKYDGAGTLYNGPRVRFEGQFNGGFPGPSGSIYNDQGQLLYSGPAYAGQADLLSLPGLPLKELEEAVREVPTIYYRDGEAGFLYRELGFAALFRYDYSDLRPTAPALGGGTELPPELLPEVIRKGSDEDLSLFTAPEDNLVVQSILVEGARLSGQIPDGGVEAANRAYRGFEAFMASRVAAIADPMAAARFPAKTEKRGDHLYEITELEDSGGGALTGIFEGSFYYLWPAGAEKKGTPPVILCSKARFGG